jgi:hypothetical protein
MIAVTLLIVGIPTASEIGERRIMMVSAVSHETAFRDGDHHQEDPEQRDPSVAMADGCLRHAGPPWPERRLRHLKRPFGTVLRQRHTGGTTVAPSGVGRGWRGDQGGACEIFPFLQRRPADGRKPYRRRTGGGRRDGGRFRRSCGTGGRHGRGAAGDKRAKPLCRTGAGQRPPRLVGCYDLDDASA